MAEASKLANVGEDFQSKLLKDTALSTVQDGLNLAFSELETSLLDENTSDPAPASSTPAPKQIAPSAPPSSLDLGFDASDVIDVDAKPAPSRKQSRNS